MRDEAEETEICLYILICLLYKESPPPKKRGGFGTIDSDVGGWGGVGVTFFYGIFDFFCRKFPVN